MRNIYKLSTVNDGTWGNSGESDDEVIQYCRELAKRIEANFDVEVRLINGPVGQTQYSLDEDTAHEIYLFTQSAWADIVQDISG